MTDYSNYTKMTDYRNFTGDAPPDLPTWGGEGVCSLDNCPIRWSIYQYRPSLAANAFFVAAFAVLTVMHTYLGIRWRSWGFMVGMLLGCVTELIGYVGRIMMWDDPFSFNAFMIQIVCLTIGPVFYTASIYVTLSKTIFHFDPSVSRFKPQLSYWIFIPLDILCLALQAAGGALSANDDGDQATADLGVDLAMAGLILQVIVIVLFIATFTDYLLRLHKTGRTKGQGWRVKAFFAGLVTAIVLILGRCAYRVAELKDGYNGELITKEGEFIALEGVFVLVAGMALAFGHPGLGFKDGKKERRAKSVSESEEGAIAMGETQNRY